MEWAGMSGDNTAVGAEARAAENIMGFRLGRVKVWAPYGELPDSRCGESFHNDHGSGTFWTTEAGGLGGSGTGHCRCMGPGIVQQQTLTEREEFRSTAIGQESEGTDADKAAGQNMEKETPQELLRGERHLSLLYYRGHNPSSGRKPGHAQRPQDGGW